MIQFYFLWMVLFLLPVSISASVDSVLVTDDFTDRSKFIDQSLLVIWGENLETKSCFELVERTDDQGETHQSIGVSIQASDYATYLPEVNGNPTLRTTTCFDYEVGQTDRSDKIVKIEFDALWTDYDTGYGELGRIVVTLVDEYPEGGPQAGDIEDLELEIPFGRPKYNIRLRNPQPVSESHDQYIHRSPSFQLYGGGHDPEGEFESSSDWGYWMPGFSSEAGGGAPGQPSASDYPINVATKKSDKPWRWNETNNWFHYTWIIEPELMSLYMRSSAEEEDDNTLVSQMAIPRNDMGDDYVLDRINEIHQTNISELPLMYNWFDTFNAVRVYFRGVNNMSFLANFNVSFEEINPVMANKTSSPSLQLYPNPSPSGIYYVGNSNSLDSFQVFDMNGRIVYSIEKGADAHRINLSFLDAGMYVVQAVLEDGRISKGKLIKTR